jgi:hypothetical protein
MKKFNNRLTSHKFGPLPSYRAMLRQCHQDNKQSIIVSSNNIDDDKQLPACTDCITTSHKGEANGHYNERPITEHDTKKTHESNTEF